MVLNLHVGVAGLRLVDFWVVDNKEDLSRGLAFLIYEETLKEHVIADSQSLSIRRLINPH